MSPSRRTQITSADNPKFKLWKSLLRSKGVGEHHLCLLSGERVIAEWTRIKNSKTLLSSIQQSSTQQDSAQFDSTPEAWLISTASLDKHLAAVGEASAREVFELSKPLYEELDVFGTHGPLRVSRFTPIEKLENDGSRLDDFPHFEVVVPCGEPSNLGSIVRSAVAFGAHRVVLAPGAAHPFHPKSIRSSSGAVFEMSFLRASSWDLLLQPSSAKLFALDAGGIDISKIQWPQKCRVILGEEGAGLPEQVRRSAEIQLVGIPVAFESLNVAVSASIALFSWSKSKSRR